MRDVGMMNRKQVLRRVILLDAIMICVTIIATCNLMSMHLEDYWSNVVRTIGIIFIWTLTISMLQVPKDSWIVREGRMYKKNQYIKQLRTNVEYYTLKAKECTTEKCRERFETMAKLFNSELEELLKEDG